MIEDYWRKQRPTRTRTKSNPRQNIESMGTLDDIIPVYSNIAYWSDVIGLAVISGAFIIIAYSAMHFLLVEKRWAIFAMTATHKTTSHKDKD
jgi:hypothetical protein